MSSFESALHDDHSSLATDLSPQSSAMLIAFGGMRGGLGMPVFEFFKVTGEIDCKKVFVRDLQQAYYQRGLPSIASDIDGIARHLQALARESDKHLVVVGNSMGGYAALLFGAMLQASTVHAFSPQTFIDYWNRLRYHEKRWGREVWSAHRYLRAKRSSFDLRKVLLSSSASATTFHVHYSTANEMDRVQAEHLKGLPNVILHNYDVGGHAIIKNLRDSGSLLRLLTEALRDGEQS